MTVGSKGLTIIAILMGLVSILCLGLAVTATSKYRTQRSRVVELEERIMSGKGELLKVPQVQLKLQEEQKRVRTVEEELAGVKEEKDALVKEYEEFRHGNELLAAAKAVSDRTVQQLEVALKEARVSVAQLDGKVTELEGLRGKLESKIAELDLDVRAANTKIKNLSSENESLKKENQSLKAGGAPQAVAPEGLERELQEVRQELEKYKAIKAELEGRPGAAGEVTITAAPEAPGELQHLRAKLAELTNELVSLTKAKVSAERTVEELQRQLAAR